MPLYAFRSPDGVEVDVLLGDARWLSTALRKPRPDAAGVPVLDLPYLVLMKLSTMRPQDLADISRLLGLASEEELNAARAVVARHSPEDSEDLESLIFLGKRELEPPPGADDAS